jgi:3-methyladenine DNA glycosylase AlkD
MNLFEKTPLAWQKVRDWSQREEEYVKRAAYALIACLAWHDKQSPDEQFINLLPLIKSGATDERNYVKKAVSWALRNIGKRNSNLNAVALQTAQNLKSMGSKPARWIGSDALRDLTSEATSRRLEKRG